MSKILYVSYDGMTDSLGQSQVIPYLIELSKLNYQITILSTEKKQNFAKNKSRIAKILQENNINWQIVNYTKKPPILSTIWDIIKLKRAAKFLQKKEQFDIIHCRSYIAAFVGISLKRQYKVKFLFDMRGFYADERVDGNIWDIKKSLFKKVYGYFKKKEKEFLLSADYVVSLTSAGKKIINSWAGFEDIKIEVIPCCADLQHFSKNNVDKAKAEVFRQKLNIKQSDFILCYLGSIGTWYMLDEMIKFFEMLLQTKPNAKFLFITRESKELVWESANKYNVPIDRLIILPGERNDLPSILSLINFGIFFIKPVFSKKASSPTKMGEIMGLGIPIICNNGVGDVDEIMQNGEFGVSINNFSDKEMERAVKNIENNFDSEKIIKFADKFYSLKVGVDRYNNIYKYLIGSLNN